jgi:transcriptional regulator with XRE-family HTH domain
MKKQLEKFFAQKGINKAGICKEAGVSHQYLNRILAGTQPITETFLNKLLPIIKSYGFDAPERTAEKK